jgi:hypothetical protein
MPRALISSCIFLALLACGKESLPQKPQLVTDRDSIGFGQEFNRGTFIGTSPQESLLLENRGLTELQITSVSIAGDTAFSIEGPDKLVVKGKDHAFLRIIFTPTAVKNYSGSISIVSNAENFPQKVITVTGRGIQPSTDGGADGG